MGKNMRTQVIDELWLDFGLERTSTIAAHELVACLGQD